MAVVAVFIVLALFASVPSTTATPEAPSVEWSRTYNGLQALSVIQTSDGGYAIAGAPLTSDAATFVKTDSSGNLQWQKTPDTTVSVVQTRDSGYALFHHNYIVKTNAAGDFESSFSLGLDELAVVQEGILTRDGDYVLVGNSREDNGEYFAWLYKVDEQGSVLWNQTFTGGFTVYAVTETNDRGCALAGNWKNNFWLAKVDSNGNLQWSQTYSYGGTSDVHFVYSMAKTKDGGFVLAGAGYWQASGGLVPWLIKINSQGHEQWSLPYGHIPRDSFRAVVQTNDEGYLVALGESAALLRTDSSGSDLWKITLDNGALNYRSSRLIRTTDGGYVVAGTALGTTALITKISPEPDTQPPVVTVSSPKSKTYDAGDISLTFTVNKPASWFGYSHDGQAEVTITGNTTLSGLSIGAHNLTVYAKDLMGMVGVSESIQFTIVARFPTELIIASIAVAVIVIVGFLVYFKRRSLSAYKKRGLTSIFKKQSLAAFASNRMVWMLTIISLCILLVFVQIFFPYFYYSYLSRNSNSTFEVGISYVYEQDNVGQIYDEVSRIKDLGFSVIRVNMVCDSTNPSAYSNTLTDVFFSAIRQFKIKVALIINNHDSGDDINYYLGKWGRDLTYVQVLNEPDVASSWDMGALFTDDEAGSRFEEFYSIVEQHQLPVKLYTNFGPAFILRTNLPVQFSEKLDFVGFDIFMESFLTLSPNMIQLLRKITNKEIVIAEFGMSTSDGAEQSDYIIRGLNLFKSMGLRGCWIVYWNSVKNNYGIRGRLAEQKVGEWIAQNT